MPDSANDPPLALTAQHFELMERANRALGRLDGLSRFLPDTSLFIYHFVLKEALLSSQIEGTQSSLSDLLLYEQNEAPGVPLAEVEEVSSYVAALSYGLARLREGFPLSLRLLRETHEVLLSTGRGSAKQLQRLNVVSEVTGKRRDRLFKYDGYMKLLQEGTEPLR